MTIDFGKIAPYISVTLFQIEGKEDFDVRAYAKAVRRELRSEGKERQFSDIAIEPNADPETEFQLFRYTEKRPPSWYSGNELKNVDNHLIALAKRNSVLGLISTDPSAIAILIRAARASDKTKLNRIRLFSAAQLEASFLDNQIRTIWLSGAHQQTAVKPDSKVMTGLELESALDPLGDQSYYYSSIRSTSSNKALETNGRSAVLGISSRQGKIWIGPARNWADFTVKISAILVQAVVRTDGQAPPILATAETNLAKVSGPYGIAIIVPEAITTNGTTDGDGYNVIQQFGDAVSFEIVETYDDRMDFMANVFWGNKKLGQLKYNFEPVGKASVTLKIKHISWGEQNDLNHLLDICSDADNYTIFYETGHTFGRGRVIHRRFRDAAFEGWRWVDMSLDDTAFYQEKTDNGSKGFAANIGSPADKSLFGLLVKHWPNLENRGDPRGWLVCDDGAMESADFIHYDPTQPKLTLIHVKGSHSSSKARELSVADYEVVVGQAIKNLRHIDRGLLADKLRANEHGQMKDAVWYNGKRQQDRSFILRLLAAPAANLKKEVVIIQPRVRKVDHDKQRNKIAAQIEDNKTRRLLQLDALLLGARADCFGLGADFVVIGDDDSKV